MVRRIPADGARYAPASGVRYVQGDFFADTDAEDWLTRLAGVDAVVNAVGILRECGAQTFDARTCVHLPLSLAELRRSLGLGYARFLPIPQRLVETASRIGNRLPGSLMHSDSDGPAGLVATTDAGLDRWYGSLLALSPWGSTHSRRPGAVVPRRCERGLGTPLAVRSRAVRHRARHCNAGPEAAGWLWIVQAGLIVFYTAVITLGLRRLSPRGWLLQEDRHDNGILHRQVAAHPVIDFPVRHGRGLGLTTFFSSAARATRTPSPRSRHDWSRRTGCSLGPRSCFSRSAGST